MKFKKNIFNNNFVSGEYAKVYNFFRGLVRYKGGIKDSLLSFLGKSVKFLPIFPQKY